MGLCGLLTRIWNLFHGGLKEIENLLTDFSHAIEQFRFGTFIPFQLYKTVSKILLKACYLALSFSIKYMILVICYFLSFWAVVKILLTRNRKLDSTKIKLREIRKKKEKKKNKNSSFQGDFATVIKRTYSSFQNSFLCPRLVTAWWRQTYTKESYDIPLDTWQEKMQQKEITFLKVHKINVPDCKLKAMIVHSISITCSLLDQFGKGRRRMNKLSLF